MKNKVLKLCKRLNKITIQEILPILMATESKVTPIIEELQAEELLENRGDGVYFYKKKTKEKTPLFMEVRTKEELNLIIRCFCGELTTVKTAFILNLSDDIIGKLFRYFRKIIYEEHLKCLIELYNNKPQIARMRKYFDKRVYYYHYKNKTWVVGTPFFTENVEVKMSKKDIIKFKKDCSKIARRLYLNRQVNYLEHHIAEIIWRLNNQTQESLVAFLCKKINL